MNRYSMLPATCQKPPWINIDVTVVINGASAPALRCAASSCHASALAESARVTAAGTIANLPTKAVTPAPSEISWTKTAMFAAISALLIGVSRRGAALSRSGIIGISGRARGLIDRRSNTSGARRVGARRREWQRRSESFLCDRLVELSHLSRTSLYARKIAGSAAASNAIRDRGPLAGGREAFQGGFNHGSRLE